MSVNDDKNLDGAKVAAAFGLKVYKCEIDLLSVLGFTNADEYLLNAIYWDESEPGISLRLKKEGFFHINTKMELTYVTIVVLASMIFVLAGIVGYLYWQQTRMLQHLQSLAMALASFVESQRPEPEPEHVEEEDDRLSVEVEEKVEVVEGPPSKTPTVTEVDVDDFDEKTAPQLRELLSKKGIPYGKRDSKSVLLQLLKASS